MSAVPARRFGSTGRDVPVIGQGTWEMETADRAAAVRALRAGLDLGLTHVDTAEMYGDGEVEELVGEAIAGRRDEVFLVSKVLPHNASRRGTIRACEASLARLGVESLDLYLLHWQGSHPLAETVEAFEELVAAGKIGAWGVSNFDAVGLREVLALAGAGRCACNQVLYHLHERGIEVDLLPLCESEGVALVGYSPLRPSHFPRPGTPGREALDRIAARHPGVSPWQVALAFLTRRPPLFAIPKAVGLQHVHGNAFAASIDLSERDRAELEQAFPAPRDPGRLAVL